MDISRTIRKAERWMDEIEGVLSVGQGEADGQPTVHVYVRDAAAAAQLPPELDGYRVVVTLSDAFSTQ